MKNGFTHFLAIHVLAKISMSEKNNQNSRPDSLLQTIPSSGEGDSTLLGRTLSSLKYREFRYLWLGMLFLMTSMQMQMVVRSYLAYEITSSPFLLGLVNAGFAMPMLVLALFGGAFADRVEKKIIIQVGQSIAFLLAVFIAVSIAMDAITWVHLLSVSMLQGALFSFLMPARQALVPQLIGKESISNAFSLDAAAMSATTLISPAIGGGLYNVIGPEGVYVLISLCCVLAFIFTGLVRVPKIIGDSKKTDVLSDIKIGVSYALHNRMIFGLLILGLLTTLLSMPFRFILPVFVVDIYGLGPESMGLLVTLSGVGAIAGSIFIAAIGKWRRGMILLFSGFLSGIALVLVAGIPIYIAATGIMILLGLGDALRQTLNQVIIMEEVEDEYRGRIMSIFMLIFALMPLGVLPAGLLAQLVNGQFSVGLMGTLLILVSVVLWFSQKHLRHHM